MLRFYLNLRQIGGSMTEKSFFFALNDLSCVWTEAKRGFLPRLCLNRGIKEFYASIFFNRGKRIRLNKPQIKNRLTSSSLFLYCARGPSSSPFLYTHERHFSTPPIFSFVLSSCQQLRLLPLLTFDPHFAMMRTVVAPPCSFTHYLVFS